jgi:polysaccharide export outer membrane protein
MLSDTTIRRGSYLTAALALITLAAGCAGTAVDFADLPTAATASPTGEYLIGPGDTLEIFVWRQSELSVTVPVRPDGRVSTPLVEDIMAVGSTPTQLARQIEEVLSEFIRSPQVNVIVQGFVGTFGEQIRVLGQAAQPRAIPYRDRMTLMDVMIEVGGLTQFAAGNRSRVVRSVDGRSEEIRVRLDDLINRGRIEQNMLMRPGDVVIIPEAVF